MDKEYISNVCENLYKRLLIEIPQFNNNQISWILNGSVLSNILANVIKIDNRDVSLELSRLFNDFVRALKGDVDICYRPIRPYKFDLTSDEVKRFYEISDEQRTYNFVDSNDEIDETIMNQLSFYETKNGLKFYAKKPQYIFLYKFKEFVDMFHEEILNKDIEKIISKRKNIIDDTRNLYKISLYYYGFDNTITMLKEKLCNLSTYLNKLKSKDETEYYNIIDKSLKFINIHK